MLDPYEDDTSTGRPEWEADALDAFVAEADRRGWQMEIHAIGDAGDPDGPRRVRAAAAANPARDPTGATGSSTSRRSPVPTSRASPGSASWPRCSRITPTRRPNQTDVWAGNIGPERAGRAWSWASIRRAGGVVALGSDWPVVPFDPILALNSAVNRQTVEGQPAGGWLPSEKLSLARGAGGLRPRIGLCGVRRRRRGTLRVGGDADLVVLDRDILAGGPSSIIGTHGGPHGRRRPGRPSLGGTVLRGFIVGTIVTAIAFYVLTRFLPISSSATRASLIGLLVLRSSSASSTGSSDRSSDCWRCRSRS